MSSAERAGCNLAHLSLMERQVMQADLIACKLRFQSRDMGSKRLAWVRQELDKLAPQMREPVMEALRARAKS